MPLERGLFDGTDPQRDEKARQEMQRRWEMETVFSEIKKTLPKDASVFTSITDLLKKKPKNGHVYPENPPFVILGIQRVNRGNGQTKEIYISSCFDGQEQAKKYLTNMRYREFTSHRHTFSYINSISQAPDDWVDFHIVDMVWLKKREILPE